MRRPLYHRLLRLRHYRPGTAMTFMLFEGSVITPALLAFADLLEWWSVLIVPAVVAALVKFNDVVVGVPRRRPPDAARGVARVRPRGYSQTPPAP
jgi:hypothetical protein